MFDPSLLLILVFLLATGALVGILSGLLDIGGGIFLAPVLLFVFRGFNVSDAVVMPLCVGTSTETVVATSIRSAWSHHRRGAVEVGILRARMVPKPSPISASAKRVGSFSRPARYPRIAWSKSRIESGIDMIGNRSTCAMRRCGAAARKRAWSAATKEGTGAAPVR
ncbi:sulfite exporter TauE/SafE family protein [Salipiger thiooxidans]|uniref:sulfite exporter TauE/SafE family protein n=1 Tax=Salipiger thiooxidans TaxID=282683 RepID=UPI001CD20194|nr:sulfite exporter TauE/SafE family protein [Salipiger thiooxidans]MCA0848012.1 sulfite exporter TauE/SafE family protein [Salipiger thiooxidans]